MTSISKNVYIDGLADLANKYNNSHHRTNKLRAVNVKSRTHIEFGVENMIKILHLKLVTM